MEFLYGIENQYINITQLVHEKCINGNIIYIPSGDYNRTQLFTDVLPNVIKHICINGIIYDNETDITIPLFSKKDWLLMDHNYDHEKKLNELHKRIQFKYGNIKDEYPEQLMSIKYLNKDAKVLEIGGNIGRNSIVISSILTDEKNLVVLESNPDYINQLIYNRNINNLHFNIENYALSKIPLIQNYWNTMAKPTTGDIPSGWFEIKTITFDQIQTKYNIVFDTLVLDCEGAIYQILLDDETILKNIKMIIIENDFSNIEHKLYVDELFRKYGLKCIYSREGPWGCCKDIFYQVFYKYE